jgi:hypothetical protein
MANTFITMKLNFTLKLNAEMPAVTAVAADKWRTPGGVAGRTLFIGWKNSLEALERYVLYVDSTKIYDQTWVGEESFIFNAGMSESVRERNPWSYTCWENVKKMKNTVCGVYVHFDNKTALPAGTEFNVEIPVKINLHQILLLASVRYLPSFCGRWEIELYPSWKNLVVATVPPKTVIKRRYNKITDAPIAGTLAFLPHASDITEGFTQIEKGFITVTAIETTKTLAPAATGGTPAAVTAPFPICTNLTTKAQCISGVDGTCTECLCSVTTFHLRYEDY